MESISFFSGSGHTVRRTGIFRALGAASLTVAFILSGAVYAVAAEDLPDTFGLRLGGYAVRNFDSVMRLDRANAPFGTYLDFQNTLGGDNKANVFRADGYLRFNERHALTFAWYDMKFEGSRVLDKDIVWNGQTFSAGAGIESKYQAEVLKLGYQYSLFHNEKVELGVGIGFHVTETSISLSRSGAGQADKTTVRAPLPVLSLFADYKFTPRFNLYYNYQFFSLNYQDKIRGGLTDFLLGLEYRVFRNIGLGIAYNRVNSNLKVEFNDRTFYHDTSWNGGMLYGAIYF